MMMHNVWLRTTKESPFCLLPQWLLDPEHNVKKKMMQELD